MGRTFYLIKNNELYHHGVKGMRWGVRRTPEQLGITPIQKGVQIKSDGSITISKGTSLQRLVGKESKDMKRLTYASVLEYDNAKYVKYIGGKGLFGGGRDKVLYLKANETLKSPSHDEATKLMSGLLKSDETFRKNLNYLGTTISNKEIQKILKDPNGSTAKAWYDILNSNMTLSSESNTYVTKKYTDAVTKKGYNMLRDENDFKTVSKAPIIILNPEKTLTVTKTTDITDELRKQSKATVKEYESMGKDWVKKYVYS